MVLVVDGSASASPPISSPDSLSSVIIASTSANSAWRSAFGQLSAVVYGLTELARSGWRPVPVAAAVGGIALAAVFAYRQQIVPEPLLDLRLLRNRTLTAAMTGMTLSTMLTGAVMLLVTQYFHLVRGLSPVRAGLCMVPAAVLMTASSLLAPRLARRIRPAYIETGSQLGFALGIAILGSVTSAVYRSRITASLPAGLPGPAASAGRESLASAVAAAHGLPAQIAAALLAQSRLGLHQRHARDSNHQRGAAGRCRAHHRRPAPADQAERPGGARH